MQQSRCNRVVVKIKKSRLQWKLSIEKVPYSGHLSIADTFFKNQRFLPQKRFHCSYDFMVWLQFVALFKVLLVFWFIVYDINGILKLFFIEMCFTFATSMLLCLSIHYFYTSHVLLSLANLISQKLAPCSFLHVFVNTCKLYDKNQKMNKFLYTFPKYFSEKKYHQPKYP